MMARAPGVGPKLAARLVLELKDKAPPLGGVDFGGGPASSAPPACQSRPRTRCWRWSASATRARRPPRRSPEARPWGGGGDGRLIRAACKELAQ